MKYILCVAACLLLTACGGEPAEEVAQVRDMVYVVTNQTGKPVKGVVLYGKGLGADVNYGDIALGDTESLTSSDLKLPQVIHVDWTDAKGQRIYQKAKLWKALGEEYTGKVRLTLQSGPAVAISQ